MPAIVNFETPEKRELKIKKEALKSLEQELADKELLLSTMKGGASSFSGPLQKGGWRQALRTG